MKAITMLSSMLFSNLPNQRRLAPQTKSEVIELMDMKANKKLFQSKIHAETGKKVTLKDLSNINSTGSFKKKNYFLVFVYNAYIYYFIEKLKHRSKNFEETIEEIKNLYKCTVIAKVHNDGTLLGMFLQDSRMKIEFEQFPEVSFTINTIYIINFYLYFLYLDGLC